VATLCGGSPNVAVILLALGAVLAVVDTLNGRRLRQGDMDTFWQRARFNVKDHRWAVAGGLLALAGAVVEIACAVCAPS
jgi:hypothetical protein